MKMNKRIKYIIIIILLIIIGVVSANFNVNTKNVVHQHLVNTKEIKTEDGEEFNTHLPLISIETGGQAIPGEARDGSTIQANIKIFDDEQKNNYLSDTPKQETLANIRYRGNSSMEFDKKGYLLKCIKENGKENEISPLGMAEHDEWVLHGPFLDKTLIRNYMWYNISSEIMEYAPATRFCELFVDGEYQGVYVLVESISRGENGRVDIDKYKGGDPFTSYIIRLDRGSSTEIKNINNFTKYTRNIGKTLKINIVYPGKDSLTPQLNKYVSDDLSKFEKALYSFDYKKYDQYIDVDSFVDYFIINEFTQNYDAGNLSTYLYKDVRGKFKFCVWDFNNACENYRENLLANIDFDIQNAVWFEMLIKDSEFVNKIIDRYKELRKTYLNEEYLLNYINQTIAYLGDAKNRNFEVWGYTFEPENDLFPEGRKIGSFEQAVSQYKDFIIKRGKWLDENIEQLKQFCHPSINKKYNH